MNSDARRDVPMPPEGNVETITIDVVCEIEKELMDSPYDMTSIVFLLYDVPDTALQRLIVYQRISKDIIYSTNMNLLHEWIQDSKSRPTWRHEFLEALLICQLYGIVRKMGFDVQAMKKHYQPDNLYFNVYINPMKKALYKLCETMNSENLNNLKKTLQTYQIDTAEYNSCELIFLKLMSEKIITVNKYDKKQQISMVEFNFEKLIKLIQKLPGLETFADDLNMIQKRCCGEPTIQTWATSFPSSDPAQNVPISQKGNEIKCDDFTDVFEELSKLNLEDFKSDSKKLGKYNYVIKNPKKLGICLIINQEDFHLCDKSIADESLRISLSKRKGSSFDKSSLEKTMSSMNFEVISRDNLDHCDMINFIKKTITENVRSTDSVFMLCIMSHGVRDHVFAADSVKVKVEDIQNLLDSDVALKLRGMPKVLLLQACQADDIPQTMLVGDAPSSDYLQKSDFLVFWATSPEYEAYRLEEAGSIFIQLLCMYIQKYGNIEPLYNIFTKVNDGVISYCTKYKRFQVPIFKSTLRKNLYLFRPE